MRLRGPRRRYLLRGRASPGVWLALALAVFPGMLGTTGAHAAGPSPVRGIPIAPRETTRPILPDLSPSSTAWTNRTSQLSLAPSPRWGAMMAYDAADGYLVLFGGLGNGHGALRDTWTWANGAWTNRTLTVGTPPTARYAGSMSYDSTLGEVVLFGGLRAGIVLADTWVFGGGHWSTLTVSASPPALQGAALGDDPSDHQLVLFGGNNVTGAVQHGTWVLANGTWTNVSGTLSAVPPPSADAAATYDPALGAMLLFGGLAPKKDLNETWSFAHGAWTNRTAASGPAPAPREYAGLAYNSADGFALLFGGFKATAVFNDSWAYNGTWTMLASPRAPSPRNAMALGYSPGPGADNATVVLLSGRGGTAANSGSFGDTWTFKLPLSATLGVAPVAIDEHQTAQITVAAQGGYPPYRLNWTNLPAGCAGSATPGTFGCDPAFSGSQSVGALVTDAAGASVGVGPETLTVNLLPSLTASASRSAGAAPLLISFSSRVSGGTAPYRFLWNFGDGTNATQQNTTHLYSQVQNVTATVTITDGAGVVNVSTPIAIEIANSLTVSTNASAYVAVAPIRVSFSADPSGGVGPYAYNWSFGAPGATAAVATPSYTYANPGIFPVQVRVTDAIGDVVSSAFNETVLAALSATFTEAFPNPPACGNGTISTFVQLTAAVRGGATPYNETWEINGSRYYGGAPGFLLPGGSDVAVNLTVTDARGDRASSTAGLRVPTTNCALQTPGGGVSGRTLELAEVGMGILAAVIALEAIVLVRGRRGP